MRPVRILTGGQEARRFVPGYAATGLATQQNCGANTLATQQTCARYYVRPHRINRSASLAFEYPAINQLNVNACPVHSAGGSICHHCFRVVRRNESMVRVWLEPPIFTVLSPVRVDLRMATAGNRRNLVGVGAKATSISCQSIVLASCYGRRPAPWHVSRACVHVRAYEQVHVSAVKPNPAFERTHSGLRPPLAAQRQR